MKSKEEYIEEGEAMVKIIDSLKSGDRTPKVPTWLRIEREGLQWYFDWKTCGWEKGVGWFWNTERVLLGGKMDV